MYVHVYVYRYMALSFKLFAVLGFSISIEICTRLLCPELFIHSLVATMEAFLVEYEGGGKQACQCWRLRLDRTYVIGRNSSAVGIRLPHVSVSRQHATLSLFRPPDSSSSSSSPSHHHRSRKREKHSKDSKRSSRGKSGVRGERSRSPGGRSLSLSDDDDDDGEGSGKDEGNNEEGSRDNQRRRSRTPEASSSSSRDEGDHHSHSKKKQKIRWKLCELNAVNGTFVNDKRLKSSYYGDLGEDISIAFAECPHKYRILAGK